MRTKIGLCVFMALLLAGCATGHLPTPEELAREDFRNCPYDYQERIMASINVSLFDPYSAMYRMSPPEKYVYHGKPGYRFFVFVNAKNRFGGYVGEEVRQYMCFADGSITGIHEFATGMYNGMKQGMR